MDRIEQLAIELSKAEAIHLSLGRRNCYGLEPEDINKLVAKYRVAEARVDKARLALRKEKDKFILAEDE